MQCKKCGSKKEPFKAYDHAYYCLKCYRAIKKAEFDESHKMTPELKKVFENIENFDVTKMFGGKD